MAKLLAHRLIGQSATALNCMIGDEDELGQAFDADRKAEEGGVIFSKSIRIAGPAQCSCARADDLANQGSLSAEGVPFQQIERIGTGLIHRSFSIWPVTADVMGSWPILPAIRGAERYSAKQLMNLAIHPDKPAVENDHSSRF